jgi:vacuolar protein sorting-associated protein 53
LRVAHVNMNDDELPHELVLSIQRILNLESSQHNDPLDVLSSDFTPIDILNGFFPDGMLKFR